MATFERKPDLDISVVSDGYVVYDPAREKVHYLNASSAVILELCNGEMTPEAIAEELMGMYALPAPPLAEVQECLTRLSDEHLIEPK